MPITDTATRPVRTAAATATPRQASPINQAAIDILVALVCILPLLLTAHLPLTDLPNHLARQYILRDWADSPILQQFYTIHWALVPNLALEIVVIALRQVMPIDLAVRAFCIVTVLLLFLGTRLVNRTLSGGSSRAYRVAPLLCYGGPFQYGFLSYCFGIGLALLLFGVWLRLAERQVIARIPFLVTSGFALMLCHLTAFGLFAVAVGLSELAISDPWRAIRRVVLPVACLTPVFALFLWFGPTGGNAADNVIRFSSAHEKLRSLLSVTFFTSPKQEAALLLLAIAGLAAALVTRTLRVHPTGLRIVAAMTLVWLVMPNVALGASFIDYRFPWAIAFFLLASLMPGPRYGALANPFAAGFAVLAAGRIALIAVLWLTWEPTLAAIDQALANLPPGSRVMPIQGVPPSGIPFRQPDLANVASYAVARRQAFDPGMFASIAGQILAFQPHYLRLWQQGGYQNGTPSRLDTLAPDYDYVLDLVPAFATIAPGLPLTCVASGAEFALMQVVPPGAAPKRCANVGSGGADHLRLQ
jgi:hypothetical protein